VITERPQRRPALYRLRWGLNDTAEFLSVIRGPHHRTADTLVCWTALQETLEAIAGR
jgi:spectinomycin phosphotransferase